MNNCLMICRSFYPAYKSGGPVRSLTNLVEALDSLCFDVITSDRDLGDETSFLNVNLNSWNNKYLNSRIFYLTPKFSLLFNLKKLFKRNKYNILYLNSFFDYKFSIKFLILSKLGLVKAQIVILAPRGELSLGAMSLKPIKKKLYLTIFKYLRLHKNITFQFTSKEEAYESQSYLGKVNYKIVPNMHEVPPEYCPSLKVTGEANMIFLSRISPKKNLLTIINSLKTINKGIINFSIVGAIDDEKYWAKCKELIKNLPKNIKVSFLGPLEREKVKLELKKSQVFFLPTLNENYGHAIVEAMMHSNMVILSNQTPWNEVSNYGGFVGDCYDEIYFSNIIKKIINMDEYSFNQHTQKTYDYCNKILITNILKIEKLFN
jgi:glycosyltransferase involved in cell wall biosynthesis